ncbi:contactin-associated protein like 5-3-like [Clavelina lepadiformis]|uniref:contactin-associated protein like 5-3-like n=1 Tax=Clavelina lepadiformis TaxID=159417 RepID=UPI004042FFDB
MNRVLLFVLSVVVGAFCQTSDDEKSCLGNTVHNYFYGPEGQTINPTHNPVGSQQQGKPGKIGPRGDRGFTGQKGTKGEPGQSSNTARELQRLQTELDALKAKLETPLALPPSCDYVRGKKSSGIYLISPEPTKLQPFYVYCNFTGDASDAYIWHDTMEEMAVSKCQAAKCYRRKISYNVDMDQIVALIKISSRCRQFIKYRCRASVMFYDSGADHASWVSRGGTQMHYWGGATSRRNDYCACGETGTCVDSSKKCNCDRNTAPETSDEGYLTDKDALPVTGLFFGDTDASDEFGWHTLGPLICSGRQ